MQNIDQLVASYLAAGGKITVCPSSKASEGTGTLASNPTPTFNPSDFNTGYGSTFEALELHHSGFDAHVADAHAFNMRKWANVNTYQKAYQKGSAKKAYQQVYQPAYQLVYQAANKAAIKAYKKAYYQAKKAAKAAAKVGA